MTQKQWGVWCHLVTASVLTPELTQALPWYSQRLPGTTLFMAMQLLSVTPDSRGVMYCGQVGDKLTIINLIIDETQNERNCVAELPQLPSLHSSGMLAVSVMQYPKYSTEGSMK